jgi:hypothetical protein
MENQLMKTKNLILTSVLACIALSASVWLGRHVGNSSTNDVRNEANPTTDTNANAWEDMTVIQVVLTDPHKDITQLRNQMQEFQRNGWAVVFISKPELQQDGTVHRKWNLRRPRR